MCGSLGEMSVSHGEGTPEVERGVRDKDELPGANDL